MKLSDLPAHKKVPSPWESGEKIPWNDPSFSQRILAAHLSQDHDWASRRQATIDLHVRWINANIRKQSRILDLGCGPGLYTQRLAQLGHHCVGVDFSPASIAYAKTQAQEHNLSIAYHQEDVRNYLLPETFDLIMMTFGECNVFRKKDIQALVEKSLHNLNPQGALLIEAHTFEAVKQNGLTQNSWEFLEQGLFSDRPHLYLQEHFWNEDAAAAITRYYIVDTESSELTEYGATMQAYSDQEYRQLFREAGACHIETLNETEWPVGEAFKDKLQTFVVRKS